MTITRGPDCHLLVIGFENEPLGAAVCDVAKELGPVRIIHLRRWPANENLGRRSLSATTREIALHELNEFGWSRYRPSARDYANARAGRHVSDDEFRRLYLLFSRYLHLPNVRRILRDPLIFNQHCRSLIDGWIAEIADAEIVGLLADRIPHTPADYAALIAAQRTGIPIALCQQTRYTNTYRIYDRPRTDHKGVKPVRATNPGETTDQQKAMSTVDSRQLMQLDRSRLSRFRFMAVQQFAEWTTLSQRSLLGLFKRFVRMALVLVRSKVRNMAISAVQRRLIRRLVQRDQEITEAIISGGSFVYFPLHVWPELSLVPLGGEWFDQVEALTTLQKSCSKHNLSILVKEHPHQHLANRSTTWWCEVGNITGVRVVATNMDSHELISKSKAVCVIAGTAAIEAVSRGIGAVSFGASLVNDIDGVFAIGSNGSEDVERALANALAFTQEERSTRMNLTDILTRLPESRKGWVSFASARRAGQLDWFSSANNLAHLSRDISAALKEQAMAPANRDHDGP